MYPRAPVANNPPIINAMFDFAPMLSRKFFVSILSETDNAIKNSIEQTMPGNVYLINLLISSNLNSLPISFLNQKTLY